MHPNFIDVVKIPKPSVYSRQLPPPPRFTTSKEILKFYETSFKTSN